MHKLKNWKNDVNPNINIDKPGFLKDKLDAAQWPVDPAVWQSVSANLSASAAAGAGAVTSSGLLTKVALWVAAASLAVATVVAVVREPAPGEETPIPTAQQSIGKQSETGVVPGSEANDAQPTENEEAPEASGASVAGVKTDSDQLANEPKAATQEEGNPHPIASHAGTGVSATHTDASTAVVMGNQEETTTALSDTEPIAVSPLSVDFEVVFDEVNELEVRFEAILSELAECEWDFGDGNAARGLSVTHRYLNEGDYTVALVARADDSRKARFEAEVIVQRTPKLVLPNIFTPNNDGRNDVLTIAPESQNITVDRMVVMDAKGGLIFEADGSDAMWDGSLPSGEPAPEGSYRLIVSAFTGAGERIHESTIVRLVR